MIVPEIAAGAAAELDDLRAACDAAVAHLLAAEPDVLAVVGGAGRTAALPGPHRGSFAPWGVPVAFGAAAATPVEPLSLLVGGWLLARHDGAAERASFQAVGVDQPAGACAALGAELAARRPRVALLVMGDGSACHGPKSPGYDDPRAQPYDDGVARALAAADADALRGLDPGLSAALKVAGRAPWQVLAGAADTAGTGWRGALLHHAAPYGVGYLVATWSPA